tara:strand:- start:297 stop:644 length:348 start_codon:yes stop_codon:yes gene_type:complete
MENESMVKNSADLGDYLYNELQVLYEHDIVGDIRGGMGLLAAVELVQNRETKERFPSSFNFPESVTEIMQKHGLLGRGGDTIPIAPPLCITKDEIDHLITQLDSTLTQIEFEILK